MSKCIFRSEWLDNPKFNWLREVQNDKRMAYCILCKQKFSLSNMGLPAVNSHQKGKKHQLKEKSLCETKSLKNVFELKNVAPSDCPLKNNTPCVKENLPSVSSSQPKSLPENQNSFAAKASQPSNIEKYLFKEHVTNSEILWCLEAVTTHRSLRSAEKDVKLFSKLFPDSEIAKSMQLGRDKMAYVIVYGIAPYFKEQLDRDLLDCSHFVIGFDESVNKVSQKQQMDINVRFWCRKTNEVKTRYFNSAFLGRSRSSDLLIAFKSAVHPLNLKKLLQVSMDGPNVNIKFFRELTDSLKVTPEDPEILNIGSCGLHTLNVAFKAGVNATQWSLFDFHRSLYYLFKDSPARRALFTQYTNSEVFPLKFCSVRWLENCRVTERSISLISSIKIFINAVEKDKIAPKSKSYSIVKKAVSDDMLPAKLAFFHMVASELESFLREYQTDAPLAPFLFTDLHSLIHRLMERFIKKDAFQNKELKDIDLNDETNFLTFRQVDIGIAAQCELKKLKKVSDSAINTFRNDCRTFLINCTRKLKERSPLNYQLTKAVSCLDPRISAVDNVFCNRLTNLLLILCSKNWLTATVADRAKAQLKEMCCKPHVILKLKSYKKQEERIDNFWINILAKDNCDDAVSLVKLVMILSHGSSNIERGFSINSDCLWENMKDESLVARRIVYDSILAAGGTKDFEVTKQLVLSVRNSHSKFMEAKEFKQKEVKKRNAESKMKMETEMELKKLQFKRAKLLEEAEKESSKLDEEIAALRLLQKKI